MLIMTGMVVGILTPDFSTTLTKSNEVPPRIKLGRI